MEFPWPNPDIRCSALGHLEEIASSGTSTSTAHRMVPCFLSLFLSLHRAEAPEKVVTKLIVVKDWSAETSSSSTVAMVTRVL